MPVYVPIDCCRCGKRVGRAKISVPLWSIGDRGITGNGEGERSEVIVDKNDLTYWRKAHTQADCDAELERQRQLRVTRCASAQEK